jgi:hypothetical protein
MVNVTRTIAHTTFLDFLSPYGHRLTRETGAAKAVVATDFVSVNANYDDGVTLHHAAQRRRGYEHAAKRVEASVG